MEFIFPTSERLENIVKNIKERYPERRIILSQIFLSYPIGRISHYSIREKGVRTIFPFDIVNISLLAREDVSRYITYIKEHNSLYRRLQFYDFQVRNSINSNKRTSENMSRAISKISMKERGKIGLIKTYLQRPRKFTHKHIRYIVSGEFPTSIVDSLLKYFGKDISYNDERYTIELSYAIMNDDILITLSNLQRNIAKHYLAIAGIKTEMKLFYMTIDKDWTLSREIV